jgi:hypothetical protein
MFRNDPPSETVSNAVLRELFGFRGSPVGEPLFGVDREALALGDLRVLIPPPPGDGTLA